MMGKMNLYAIEIGHKLICPVEFFFLAAPIKLKLPVVD
jgi:hypothetical protein